MSPQECVRPMGIGAPTGRSLEDFLFAPLTSRTLRVSSGPEWVSRGENTGLRTPRSEPTSLSARDWARGVAKVITRDPSTESLPYGDARRTHQKWPVGRG